MNGFVFYGVLVITCMFVASLFTLKLDSTDEVEYEEDTI